MERELDVQGECLSEICGAIVGCIGRVTERELLSECWMWRKSG